MAGGMAGEPAIQIAGLRKTFHGVRGGKRVALDGLDLLVPSGGTVHGFLGPNGSGKTTTVRILLGLVAADAGTLRMLGRPVPAELPAVIGQVGAIVETPLFFPTFSGRRNLELLAGVAGVPDRRVDEVLEQVGLRGRDGERVKGYSLGMRQRLAVAAALLKSPTLLLLDEPSNGLDPGGIREMRDLLRRLASGGVTVLLSSHLLAEVQQVCDSVSIISRGRHVATGLVRDVLAARSTGELRVRLADLGAGRQVLSAAGFVVHPAGDALLVRADDGADVSRCLAGAGLYPSELVPQSADLEDVFLGLTRGSGPADPPGPPGAGGPPSPRAAEPTPVRS